MEITAGLMSGQEKSVNVMVVSRHSTGFHCQNAAAPDCLFVSLRDVGVTLV